MRKKKKKKTGLTCRSWTDSFNSLDERQITECADLLDLSKKIESDSARRVMKNINASTCLCILSVGKFFMYGAYYFNGKNMAAVVV